MYRRYLADNISLIETKICGVFIGDDVFWLVNCVYVRQLVKTALLIETIMVTTIELGMCIWQNAEGMMEPITLFGRKETPNHSH